ncbi:Pyruvate/2-oxoglutarate dehydrogenase complex, dihydrolipoamide dehydrogenase (E3) component, and related enzyme [Edwardsiella anguillarum]|uniref:FAD-dependent oxidoreductase n=1 Tax=Edwardsiella TaxID=635 RepID=UPI0005EDE51E|nr:bifunctional TVP38/TMEM64 family protein/FAD-dependent oxidoreductase [Edwardsiella anguillarum]AKM48138.1 pyridine nucleotide-disulfide oxidoreductase [Edwardsiella sp. EA181011]RFT03964.1 pyridine nucleotide-disulfide oxidoreductase [Edwardsiella anguillarum]BET80586.1 Pyruvate/2-oxoglutarate dehydrogenase complex, dihydrolipoamide dehydrogenase (E3) component, and related enzyme [Edwardsiella anguillarum]BET83875.1 Pyruvate/2-oxoglutarate dehydrogenase complex, dihydrolipoamide dehydrogen
MKKTLILLLLLLLILAFFILDGQRWLTFETLKQHQAAMETLRHRAPWQSAAAFFALYLLVAALSLPGAAVMTLAAGLLFGLWQGTLLVSFASSAGATLAFLASRFLLRDTLRRRLGERLATLNQGLERDGAFYLFTLRLVPLMPFFLINLLLGLSPLSARRFYWVSQLGMLPGTLIYVNAGTRLADIDSLAAIVSPTLLLSFTLLGVFPWLARFGVRQFAQRRYYHRWRRPRHVERNLVVIGAGAAGLVSAYIAATVRAKVTLIERDAMGGDCLNTGCVPSKALIRSATLAHQMRHADRYGLPATPPALHFTQVMARVRETIQNIAPHDSVERYTALGVEVLNGRARVISPWQVAVDQADGTRRIISTRAIVIAAGAEPIVPDIPGLQPDDYLTSDTLWQALAQRDAPPPRLLVLGGGPIGCELSQALARLGAGITLVQRGPRVLPKEDVEVSERVQRSLCADGITLFTDCQALRIERDALGKRLIVSRNGQEIALAFDDLLLALGRRPRLTGYGLEQLGIESAQQLCSNAYLQSLCPTLYVAGDVAGGEQFTHLAAHMAWYASVNALFGRLWRWRIDDAVIPRCTFVDPQVARVGLNESEARRRGIPYEVTRFALADLDRAITDGATEGFITVLTPPGKDRLLGVTIVGEQAGEMLAEYTLAMRHGIGLNKLLATVHPYPTYSEANKYTAGVWKKAHAPQRALAWLARYHRWQRGRPHP